MKFTGKNLEFLRRGIELSLSDISMQIGIIAGAGPLADEDIKDLVAEHSQFKKLLTYIDKSISREKK